MHMFGKDTLLKEYFFSQENRTILCFIANKYRDLNWNWLGLKCLGDIDWKIIIIVENFLDKQIEADEPIRSQH